jgi:Family of unknown function (DUF6455)
MIALPRGQISSSPIEAILQWMWDRSRSKTLNELQSCGEQEVQRIARNSGVSVAEFRMLARLGPNATDLLERRMAALGLDSIAVSTAAPQTFRDLQRICSYCESPRRCLRDLARDPANPAWKDYCPNAKMLMALHAKAQRGIPTRCAP